MCPILFVGHWWDVENKTCHKSDGLVCWFNVNCVVGFYIRLSGMSQICPKAGNKKGGNLLNPAEFLARATGLEPVTYGLTVNCTIFSKTAEVRRKLGAFICDNIGCVLFLCVSVCFCSKFLKQPKAIKNNYK